MRVGWLILTVCFFAGAGLCPGQQDEMELAEKISELQRQLASSEIPQRDAAEKALLKLGPTALDFLEPADDETTTDTRERLARIRTALEKLSIAAVSQASKITLVGEMTVGQAIQKIKEQSSNRITVADDSLMDRKVKLNSNDIEFWKAIDELLETAQLEIDRYGGRPGLINLVPSMNNEVKLPVDYAKIFQLGVTRIDSSLNLRIPQQNYTTISLQVRWEPRLRPISVDMPMSSVKVIDEFDDPVAVLNPEEVAYGMVQPEIPELEFAVRLSRVDRQVEELKSITAKIEALLPGRTETFQFKKLNDKRRGWKQQKAGATVAFEGIRKNEDIYGVTIGLSFDEENNALESHQGWVFQNEVFLLGKDGEREDSISMETIQQDNSRVVIQYFFVDDPTDRTLVYKTPAAVVQMPVEIKLTKIPLP